MENGKQKNFRNLDVWQLGVELADAVYDICSRFPKHELYGIVSQMTKAAVSVPSNIAEGHERNTTTEFIQFLGYARGSLAELETQVEISYRRKFMTEEEHTKICNACNRVSKMLWALINSLENKTKGKARFSNLQSPISEAANG